MSTEPTLIGDRYELGELLGRGGMAEVRKARDTRLGRTVAVKRLRTDLASDAAGDALVSSLGPARSRSGRSHRGRQWHCLPCPPVHR